MKDKPLNIFDPIWQDVFLEAYRRITQGEERYSCNAIHDAGLHDYYLGLGASYDLRNAFQEFFRPTHTTSYWVGFLGEADRRLAREAMLLACITGNRRMARMVKLWLQMALKEYRSARNAGQKHWSKW